MPRRYRGPRLYLDRARDQWVIRDKHNNYRIPDCRGADVGRAERALAEYLGSKHKPTPSPSPSIADVLTAYMGDKGGEGRRAINIRHTAGKLLQVWGTKTCADVTTRSCRSYADTRTPANARRELETLRAAINHWHKNYGPLAAVPSVTLPPRNPPRQRWLTRSEAAALLWSARKHHHLARFILLGLATGTRSGALLALQWDWLDLDSGVMLRRAPGEAENPTKRRPPVRLGRKILAHLRRWKRLDGPMVRNVIHYHGAPIRTIKGSWRQAVKRARLDDAVTPHTLRHTRATWLMKAGIDPWRASQHLGMSVKILLSVYGQHHPDFQKEAAEI